MNVLFNSGALSVLYIKHISLYQQSLIYLLSNPFRKYIILFFVMEKLANFIKIHFKFIKDHIWCNLPCKFYLSLYFYLSIKSMFPLLSLLFSSIKNN